MNRVIKIRYVLKNKHTGEIHNKWYTIQQIENGLSILFDTENYEMVSRDRFTGLLDKNGKEIYEGDIVTLISKYKNREYTGEIAFEKYFFYAKEFYFTHYDNPVDIFSEESNLIEIIGNIHEHPYLLNP